MPGFRGDALLAFRDDPFLFLTVKLFMHTKCLRNSCFSSPTQNTINSKIVVYYPFHPLHGLKLDVVCRAKKGDGAITVVSPDGTGIRIPRWMAQPGASNYKISEQKEISIQALLLLTDLMEIITNK